MGETEVVDNNLNPEWIKHFNVKYIFHKDMELWFQVWHVESEDEKKLIGETTIKLSQLMMNDNQTLEQQLYNSAEGSKPAGRLKIQADCVRKSEDIIKFQITGNLKSRKFLCFGSDHPYLLIERGKEDRSDFWLKVFKTDFKYDETNPWWDAY